MEGQISRLTTIKRAMCGHAGFGLLRQRILQAASGTLIESLRVAVATEVTKAA